MKTFLAPNGRIISIPESRVISFGFTEKQNDIIAENLPTSEYELYETDVVTDIFAINSDTVIINSEALNDSDREMIIDYFTETQASLSEMIFWIGNPKPPSHLRSKFVSFEYIEMLAVDLKYRLLKAHKMAEKSRIFSKRLADCIMILAEIRRNPGVKSKELAQKFELSVRTVQRYITTLQAAGEWIEYDTVKRGWKLQYGCSILFGDTIIDEEIEEE